MKFHKLSAARKKAARQAFIDDNPQYPYDNWWIFDDFIEVARILGISVDEKAIWFSGFWSQGDGASFNGHYAGAPDAVKEIKEYAPQDTKLHAIAEELTAVQVLSVLETGERLSAKVHTQSSSYSHSGCMQLRDCEISAEFAVRIIDTLRSLADWLYAQLEQQYNYCFSDECLDNFLYDEDIH